MNKKGILIGSDKGGVGKSLFAQLVVGACDIAVEEAFPSREAQREHRVKLCEIDHRRRLSTILGSRVDLSLDPHELAMSGNARGPVIGSQFDPVYDLWRTGNSITDLGANVTTPLFDWFESNDILSLAKKDDLSFEFVAVASADDQALRSACQSLTAARRVFGSGSGVGMFLVLNDMGAVEGFSPFERTDVWRDIQKLRDDAGIQTINMPRCRSRLVEWAQPRGMTVFQLIDNEAAVVDAICREAGWGHVQKHREMNALLTWLEEVHKAVTPLFQRFEIVPASQDRVVPLARRAS